MESKIQNRKPVLSNAEGSKIKNSSQAAPRIDLKDKVTGQAQYVEDLPPGTVRRRFAGSAEHGVWGDVAEPVLARENSQHRLR